MIKDILALIRIKDWVKNIIIFLPLIFSGNLSNVDMQLSLIFTFIIFSFTSTSIYILNDIVDLKDDQNHSIKKIRKPLAAEKLSINFAKFLLLFFTILVIILILYQPASLYFIIIYALINISYSLFFKKIPFLEIVLICSGYLIRLEVGSYMIQVETSLLLMTSIFSLSFFVILIKRFVEIIFQDTNRKKQLNYTKNILKIFIFLAAAIFLLSSLMFFILFNNYLLFIFPLLIFILFKYYKSSIDLNLGEFPIELVIKDKKLLLSCLLLLLFTIYIYY